MRKLQASDDVVYRTLQALKNSGKFRTFYFSGKVNNPGRHCTNTWPSLALAYRLLVNYNVNVIWMIALTKKIP